jgi:hypothetical protein
MVDTLTTATVWDVLEQLRDRFGAALLVDAEAHADILGDAADAVAAHHRDELAQQLRALQPLLDRLARIAAGRHKRQAETDLLFVEMTDAIAAFLTPQGFSILVMGNPRVQQDLTDRKGNFEFVIKFTGRAPGPPPRVAIEVGGGPH